MAEIDDVHVSGVSRRRVLIGAAWAAPAIAIASAAPAFAAASPGPGPWTSLGTSTWLAFNRNHSDYTIAVPPSVPAGYYIVVSPVYSDGFVANTVTAGWTGLMAGPSAPDSRYSLTLTSLGAVGPTLGLRIQFGVSTLPTPVPPVTLTAFSDTNVLLATMTLARSTTSGFSSTGSWV